jgi:hypothetical protein
MPRTDCRLRDAGCFLDETAIMARHHWAIMARHRLPAGDPQRPATKRHVLGRLLAKLLSLGQDTGHQPGQAVPRYPKFPIWPRFEYV